MADINPGNFTETLNNKADRDLANTDNTNLSSFINEFFSNRLVVEKIMDLMLPDYSVGVNMSSPYTAPYNGIACWNNGGTSVPTVNDVQIAMAGNDSYNEGPALVFLHKGDVLKYGADAGLQRFYPLKGAK